MLLEEVTASLYPQDLHDEGVEHCLDVLASRASINSAYLVAMPHKEKRPLMPRFFPHNPVRRFYLAEDSRAYWRPSEGHYERIKPLTSERDFLKGTDWLQVLIEAARARGMKTGAEISHTVIDAEVAREDLGDLLQRDVFGRPLGAQESVEARRALLCPNQPDVYAYLTALFNDLATNYDLDFIQTCLLMFDPGDNYRTGRGADDPWQRLMSVATGGCFCVACEEKARAEGLDWDAIVRQTRHLSNLSNSLGLAEYHERQLLDEAEFTESALLIENEAFTAWLHFRARSVAELLARLKQAIVASGHDIDLRYNTSIAHPDRAGIDFKSAFAHVDSVRESDYSDQLGTPEGAAIKRRRLMKVRRALREDQKLIAALGIRPDATPESLRLGVKAAVDSSCDGLSLGHYDGATMERLDAVTAGLREWEGQPQDWQPSDPA